MIIHHIVTITLMAMSWSANMIRVGTLILCVHDAVDYMLEVCLLLFSSITVHSDLFQYNTYTLYCICYGVDHCVCSPHCHNL